jgi:GNAT superfamily N-acetyltransferase
VYNHLFRLKEKARRQGIGALLYDAEGELYRRWGLSEIHMTAMDDGLEVWVKKFRFLPVNAGALAAEYPGWARPRAQPIEPPEDPADYPSAFLRSRNQLDLYKVLV